MKAIISDIHSNLEALQAVLADIARHDVDEIYCLGDLVGYGPNPRECVDLARQWQVCLLGNHDDAALNGPTGFAATAGKAILWSQRQLKAPLPSQQDAERRWAFLAQRPRSHRVGNFFLVHGSPRDPLHEYVFPEDIYNARKMEQILVWVDRYCLHGHTHVPGIITADLDFHSPEQVDYVYRLDRRKTLCNVGSVGQPRDGDWRACYVLLDDHWVHFRRVEYDIDTTIRKINDVDDLDDSCGDRLGEGR